jgi:hypothetical protein
MRSVETGVKVPKIPSFPWFEPAAKKNALAGPEVCGVGCPRKSRSPSAEGTIIISLDGDIQAKKIPK